MKSRIASPCQFHRRHLYEDLVICEVVDDTGAPVPAGTTGSRLLVTVLFSRTLPLIRYELSDRVVLDPSSCPCARPFRTLAGVEGRQEDILMLPGARGAVRVHPNVLHEALDTLPVTGWQVLQEPEGLLRVLVTSALDVDAARITSVLRKSLARVGVTALTVRVQQVNSLPRTALGKTPLVRALPPSDGPTAAPSTPP